MRRVDRRTNALPHRLTDTASYRGALSHLKTKSIINKIINPHYIRKPEDEIQYLTKNETKSLIIARYGMLECGNNFKGTMRPICASCDVVDNEYHRLNECSRYASTNLFNKFEKVDFNLIYSPEVETIWSIITQIKLV